MDVEPDSSAVRTALWRALHVEVDDEPHLIEDPFGLAMVAPGDDWRERGDMHPAGTMPYRGGIVARTRHVEDLLVEERIDQYVLLGAGLDTFAQRRPRGTERVRVFEVDQPGPQAWKRRRLAELDHEIGDMLHLVPVDFEADGDWWSALLDAGFDPSTRTVVSSSGVSMYISREATVETLRALSALGPGSVVVMTFMLPLELVDEVDRPGIEAAARGAEASGTPWISFYRPEEMRVLARDAGFADVRIVSTVELTERHLVGRSDGLRAASGEALLIART